MSILLYKALREAEAEASNPGQKTQSKSFLGDVWDVIVICLLSLQLAAYRVMAAILRKLRSKR